MKYPPYRDFLSELEKCQESIKHGTFTASGEITRTATIGNHQVEIKLYGAGRCEILVDGGNQRRREMRSLYSANKAEFNELLEKLKEATTSVGSAIASILETLTSDQVPALVLERLKGNKIATDPAEATKDIASHQADMLAEKIRTLPDIQFRVEAKSHGEVVVIGIGGNQGTFEWSAIQGSSDERGRFNNCSIEDNLLFIKIFPELEEYVNGVVSHLQEIQRLGWQMAQR